MTRLCLPCGPVVDQRKQRGGDSGRNLVAVFVAFVPLGGIRKKTGTVRLAGKYLVCENAAAGQVDGEQRRDSVFPEEHCRVAGIYF